MLFGLRERMEHAMKMSKKSKSQIAREINVDRKVFSNNNHDVKLTTIAKFCHCVNCDANWLLGLKRNYKKLNEQETKNESIY